MFQIHFKRDFIEIYGTISNFRLNDPSWSFKFAPAALSEKFVLRPETLRGEFGEVLGFIGINYAVILFELSMLKCVLMHQKIVAKSKKIV
jgi:hypothetical protein